MIQFGGQFAGQFKTADEAVDGQQFGRAVLCINDPQHQLAFRLVQLFDELLVAGFNLLLFCCQVQRLVEAVV